MERRKSMRRSSRKEAKVKEGGKDQVKIANNYPLVLAKIERLTSENTHLKQKYSSLEEENTRLRQKLEFKEVTDRNQSNNYVFPANHQTTVEQEVGQGVAEVEADVVEHRRRNDPASIERQMERIISLHEDRNNRENKKEICKLQKTIESLAEQIKELTSSGQKYDISTITKDKRTWSDMEASATVDSSCASLDQLNQLNQLLEKQTQCTQKRLEMMEELLAKEMHDKCSLQQKLDNMEIELVPDLPQIKTIPPSIKTLAWKLQSYMVTMEKVKAFGRHLGLEPDLVNGLAEKNKHSPFDAFWSSICHWCADHGDVASVDLLRQACIEAKIDVFSRGLFPESHQRALEMTIPDLEEDLHPSSTLSHLRSKGVLGTDDVYYVTSQKTRRERVTALVSLLPLFGETAFDVFLDALESDHQHLAEALKNNLARCSSSSKYVSITEYEGPSVTTSLSIGQSIKDELLFKTILAILASCKRTEAMNNDLMHCLCIGIPEQYLVKGISEQYVVKGISEQYDY